MLSAVRLRAPLRLKHQGCNPTGSFKDTGMTTAVTQARILGARTVVCASTGNTAASLAAYAARAELKCAILVPRGQVSHAKLAQSLDYGATALPTDGVAGHDYYLTAGSATLRAVSDVVLSGGPGHDRGAHVS